MAAILIAEQTTELTFIWQKLDNTIQIYTERYPELMYVSAGMKRMKQNSADLADIDFLNSLINYLKENLSEYYVIKIMQYKLQLDLQALISGTEVDKSNPLYLDF